MDNLINQELVKLGVDLTTLAVKGTATAISSKVKSIKEEKNVERIRNTYDEIINELIQEREEAIRIAQIYKSELDRVAISDKDIEHLNNTISRILEIFKDKPGAEALTPLKEFINMDTLKTMQLLGFNYKAAIGEPLTVICADVIKSLSKRNSQFQGKPNNNRK